MRKAIAVSLLAAALGLQAQYIRGPRGGCYTITSSGRKRYVDRSLCDDQESRSSSTKEAAFKKEIGR